jgi:nucleoside-diphosphate-sugar epimerase
LIYGARRDLFFPHFGFRALGGKIMVKIGWEKKILPLTYVENTCEIIVKLLTHDDVIGKVYNIVDPQTITYNQYLDYYKKAMGVKPLVIPMPFSALLCAAFVFEQLNKLPRFRGKFGLTRYRLYPKFKKVRFDGSLVLKTLDWYPNISLEEGLKRAFSR